ncbi:MAG: pyrophosphatase, partial [Rhodospirillaceae bacterium]|nr:pyrophosphatase [Rhodospirillaceae bacterium]
MMDSFTKNDSLTLELYQDQASLTDHGPRNFTFPILGLFGEVGSLLSEVKKQQRDTIAYIGYADNVLDELGDVLWYLTAIASRAEISIADIAYATLQNHHDCYDAAPLNFPFIELQSQPPLFSPTPTPAFEITLMRLASAVGALINDQQQRELENDRDVLFRHLVRVLGILVQAAE